MMIFGWRPAMPDGVSVKITGVDALVAKFESITYETRMKGGRAALRKAAQLIRDAARQNVAALDDPSTPENIGKNITERWNGKLFKSTGDLGFRIGVAGGALQQSGKKKDANSANPGGDTFYWRFLEFGTSEMPARPFLRPAMENNLQKSTDVFAAEYDKALDRAIRRGKKP